MELEIKGEHKESKICVFSVDGLGLKLQDEEKKLVMTVSFSARRKHQHHDWYIQTTASNFTEEEKVEYKIYRPRYVSTGYWAERFQTGTNNFEEIMSIVKDFITTLKVKTYAVLLGFLPPQNCALGFEPLEDYQRDIRIKGTSTWFPGTFSWMPNEGILFFDAGSLPVKMD